jgi:HAAS domain-containing protein
VTGEDYLREVGFGLRDLPWRMRRDLLAELHGHLEELPADTDLEARLGSPEEYAADLRSAAGLERTRGAIAFLRARRPRNLILAAVALTVIGLAIGAVEWVDSYQPIAFAGGTQFPPDSKPSVGQSGVTVTFRKGRPFEYGITIQNTGRFTVRVLGVPRSVTDFYSGRLLMSEDQTGHLDERPLERFHPFDMKPGSFRWLVLQGVYACTTGMGRDTLPGAAGITWGAFPVRFSFLWRTATASIPLAEGLAFSFPKGCPPAKNRTITP